MNAEQLIFAAAQSAFRAKELCENLWTNQPVKFAPKLDPHKCAQLIEAARELNCAAQALQLEASGVKPPRHGD
jgi:hypothetical protein